MALFMAADEPLPLIAWDESHPAFHVDELSDGDEGVRRHFTKPYAYYLGAHTGCSCGFSYGQLDLSDGEDVAEDAQGRASVEALRTYLEAAIQRLRAVELFSSWEGDWNQDAEQRLEIAPSWFGGAAFRLPEKVAYLVKEESSGSRR